MRGEGNDAGDEDSPRKIFIGGREEVEVDVTGDGKRWKVAYSGMWNCFCFNENSFGVWKGKRLSQFSSVTKFSRD